MANIWRRILEAMTVLGFGISVWAVPQTDLKWCLGGATTSVLVCVLLYEILLTRKDRELLELERLAGSAVAEKDHDIQLLKEEIEKLADPELMAIYKEDERERLRIQREDIERAKKSEQKAIDAARQSALQSNQLLNEVARKNLGLD